MSGDRGGYWGVGEAPGFGGWAAHLWRPIADRPRCRRSACWIVMYAADIATPSSRSERCKRCVKSLIAMKEREDEKRSLRNMTEADFREAHG